MTPTAVAERISSSPMSSMSPTRSHRVAAVVGPALVAALVLASCGGSDSAGPTRSTIALDTGSTAFQTIPPVTTTTTLVPPVDDGTSTTEQSYVVQSGDWPLRVAELFEVSLDDLINYNGWASVAEFPFPGTEIKIPPGGRSQAAIDTGGGEVAEGATDEGGEEAVGESIPEAGDNCQAGSYTIEEGDVPLRVANKFDVSLDALNAANATTNGYSAFFVGLQIVIPAKEDC